MSTLDEIAKLSGFSKATVSRVLNDSPHVSKETREKILAIMKETDYVPNRNAISLSKGQTQQIGMITLDLNELILCFMNSFVEISGRYGYQTIIYTTGGDKQKELQAFEDLKQKRVDALLILTAVNDKNVITSYCKYGPIVSWQRMDHPEIPSVAMNQYDGYALALEHLIERGYTRIANAFGRPSSINTQSRRLAYEQIMTKYNLPIVEKWYYSTIYGIRDGEQLVRTLIGQPDQPDAILCSNDLVAVGVLSEARRQQLDVPRDLAIIGFDNSELSQTLGITTVRNPIAGQAENAFLLLAPTLLGLDMELQPLSFQLIERETT
ncbi:LacI family DNA-binding transcriptional regulator [Paenibacillus sp. FSL L8-0493]|uniref:LacI family DNA-binding transcriptional regulator n=1 Tax=Paenibacillus TaxID=44249 RepID=UPI00096D622A|nr:MULTISPECIES: LacI family DNA-binding transcriptional regulator [Paenibacillus]MDH6431057.1 DNA-binding LacI/PurR family transcriptional regulator [Paenibacillus sp. PastH-4]MDH6447123.1 DNA-binding LacI/PurR family transcriptional regulator [Paenibacillus sp. PastF-4]MDH6531271.1 DNA-binding LacI/PurR family transcriptional regulator [Paenibacillus sp. PastH-3]OMC68081.1 transcriptional regulator [Paenibacillus odorifer]OMD58344.1 transcriptional regulator [Paenibacillus odorifer]